MISVIIPTYNRSKTIGRAIESVLSQEIPLEVIIVDDGSTDDTESVVAQMNDARIQFVKQEKNSGACAARNAGVALARGEYIAFQDSDDRWHSGKLQRQLQVLEETGADVVFCRFDRYGMEGELKQTFPHDSVQAGLITYEQLLFENLMSTQTVFGRAECFRKVPFDPSFPRLQDWDLALRLARQYRLWYDDRVMVDLLEQQDSLSNQPEKAVQALKMLYRKHRDAINQDDRLTIQMLYSLRHAADQCGADISREYMRAVSAHKPLRRNLAYIYHGAGAWLQHHMKAR